MRDCLRFRTRRGGIVRLLVAGAGAFGCEHLRSLASVPGLELAVADKSLRTAQSAALAFGCKHAGDDALTMIDRVRPDAVVVATPASSHLEIASYALDRCIPVLLEKPVAVTAADARKLLALEEASTTFVQPGHVLRFSPMHKRLAEFVRAGEIGTLLGITSRRYRDVSHTLRYPDVDQVLMTMIHDIDLAIWIGQSTAVSAHAVRASEQEGGTATDAFLSAANGIQWHLSTAWVFPSESVPSDRLEVLGTRGAIELEVGGHLRASGARAWEIAAGSNEGDPLRLQLECFLAGVEAGTNLAGVSLIDAINGLSAAEMIVDSLTSGSR